MQELTDRQLEVFQFLEAFLAEKGYAPTRQEIAEHFDFTSVNAAQQHLEALEKKCVLRIAKGKIARGIVLLARTA